MVGAVGISVAAASLVGVAAVVSLGLAWYSWRYAEHPVSDRFALVLAADGIWAVCSFFKFVSPTDALATAWLLPESTVSPLAAALWFLFVIEYTGDSGWIPGVVTPLVVGHAFVYGALYAVNPGRIVTREVSVSQFGRIRLPVETFGPISLLEIALIYVILITTYILLGRFFLQTRNLYRKQTGIILGVSVVVVLANAAHLAGFSPHPDLDLTTVFFIVQALGVGVALHQYDFLRVTPLAASKLIEEMPDPVFVVASGGRILDYNDAAAAFLPETSRQPAAADVAIDSFENILGTPDDDTTNDTRVTAQDDGRVVATFDSTTTAIRDQYGEVQGEVVVFRDISEREANKRALEAQNERLDRFASMVSHDLINPLHTAEGYLDLARESNSEEHFEKVAQAHDRMESIIEELLTLARTDSEIDEKDVEVLSFSSVVTEAWATAETSGATLKTNIPQGMSIAAAPVILRQILENLFQNAIDHNEPPVTVTVGTIDGDGFYVEDDGVGIPEPNRDEAFEYGYTTDDGGTGLGLSIVQELASAHNWTIHVTEGVDGGARFEITGASID